MFDPQVYLWSTHWMVCEESIVTEISTAATCWRTTWESKEENKVSLNRSYGQRSADQGWNWSRSRADGCNREQRYRIDSEQQQLLNNPEMILQINVEKEKLEKVKLDKQKHWCRWRSSSCRRTAQRETRTRNGKRKGKQVERILGSRRPPAKTELRRSRCLDPLFRLLLCWRRRTRSEQTISASASWFNAPSAFCFYNIFTPPLLHANKVVVTIKFTKKCFCAKIRHQGNLFKVLPSWTPQSSTLFLMKMR